MPPVFPPGTQVVLLTASDARPAGTVAAIVAADLRTARVRFADGSETTLAAGDLTSLKTFKRGSGEPPPRDELFDHRILQVVIGSRAFGLATDASDIDRRGVFLPPAERHWSLTPVPEQIECDRTQEVYWELAKFARLALAANPNILECLWSPLVERTTPIGEELLAIRRAFLSKRVYQTYSGYVLSQFQKIGRSVRNRGEPNWRHAMHLIRLLESGIALLETGKLALDVGSRRDTLLAIKRGERTLEEVDAERLRLHERFEQAFARTSLPDGPDFARVDRFVIDARRAMAERK